MSELWSFLTGNFVDACLFMLAVAMGALFVGSILAAWMSFRDESQYRHRQSKIDKDLDMLGDFGDKISDAQSRREELQAKEENLLFLKHIAIRQTVKYIKYTVFYFVVFILAMGGQSWHMEREITNHEVPLTEALQKNEDGNSSNITIKSYDDGVKRVSVKDASNNATYEYVYSGEQKDNKQKTFQQKVNHLPSVLANIFAGLWLLMIWGIRYLRRTTL